MREITIAWMYHDIMDLYGDKGNIIVFKKRCEDRGIQCNVDTVGIDEPYDFKKCDILFIGGGADKEQCAMYNDLVKRKQAIIDAMNEGMLVLLICGGYQLFGKYYEDADGNKLEGLGIFDYYTVNASTNDAVVFYEAGDSATYTDTTNLKNAFLKVYNEYSVLHP